MPVTSISSTQLGSLGHDLCRLILPGQEQSSEGILGAVEQVENNQDVD